MVNESILLLGGRTAAFHLEASSQIVRDGHPTVKGPNMTEGRASHCSATLEDGSVIVAGGMTQSNRYGSSLAEVYIATTLQWERRGDMQRGRLQHACTSVWLDPNPQVGDGIISTLVDSKSVLSIIAAGGEMVVVLLTHHRVLL